MIEGVVSGLSVLFWAIVLLGVCIFVLATAARMIIGEQRAEFSSMAIAMLTIFRCVTDGCSASNGTPLQEHLYEIYGSGFVLIYYIIYLSVTIGLFNLIMSIFIQAVLDSGEKRLQQTLGTQRSVMQHRITTFFSRRFVESIRNDVKVTTPDAEIAKMLSLVPANERVVDRELFDLWTQCDDFS